MDQRREAVGHVVAYDAVDRRLLVDLVCVVEGLEDTAGELAGSRLVVRAEGKHRAHALVEDTCRYAVGPHADDDLVDALQLLLGVEEGHDVCDGARRHGDLRDIGPLPQLLDAAEDVVRDLLEVVHRADDLHTARLGLLIELSPLEVLLDVDVLEIAVEGVHELGTALPLAEGAASAVLDAAVGHDARKVDKGRKNLRLGTLLLRQKVEPKLAHIYVVPLGLHPLEAGCDGALRQRKTDQCSSPCPMTIECCTEKCKQSA